MNDAYAYLELDDHQKIEAKKKGVTLDFITTSNGDPAFRIATQIEQQKLRDMPTVKVKLRHFTEEQKQEIQDRVT